MWNILTADFGGDETANFGPRKEAGSALFQIDTMATLSCEDKMNSSLPSIKSAVIGDLTCFSVDQSLVMNSTSLHSFEFTIDEMEWSPDGSFLVFGDNGGCFYIIDGESNEIIFSFPLVQESRKVGGKAFRKILFSDTGALVLLTADGQLMVLDDLEVIKQGGNEMELMRVIKERLYTVQTGDYHSQVCDVVIQGDFIYTLGGGDYIICKWEIQHDSIELFDGVESSELINNASIQQGSGTTDGNFLFLLDSNGYITVWETSLMICIKQFTDTKTASFCLLENQSNQDNSLTGMKLVMIYATSPDETACDLNVFSLPTWECVYNLQLEAPSMLAKCNTMQDDLYITEVCGDGDRKTGTISTVRFRCLKETDPKTRLYKLLQKNKFEEAEMFAKLFRLDRELVNKAKCNFLLNELSPWNTGKLDEETVKEKTTQFWNCLKQLDDHLYAAEVCLKAALQTPEETEALQSFCKEKLSNVDSKDQAAKEKLELELLQMQNRWVTFKMTFGEDAYTSKEWQRLMHADLLQESLSLIQRGHLDKGLIIWKQHQAEWTGGKISSELIVQVLANIPYTTPPVQLCGYISTVLLPVIMREVPMTLTVLIDYVIEKAKSMETKNKKLWPSNAIDFCDFVIQHAGDALGESTCLTADIVDQIMYKCDTMLEPLKILRNNLQQLHDIIHKYNCYLSLGQFLQETTETITFRMLDRVHAIQLIIPTLEKQVRPYMKEHGLNQDNIFSKYIKDLLQRQGQIQSYTGELTWEAKSLAIIDCISDPEQKIEGIMEIMKWAPIPWSDKIEGLVQMGLKLKHNAVQKLKEQCERAHLRKYLIKYGLKNIEVPQGPDAERLAYFMLKQDKPGCMEDALEVMKSSNVKAERNLYKFRMKELISADKLEECLHLLKSLPTKLGLQVGYSILLYTSVMLDHADDISGLKEESRAEKRLFTAASVQISKYLQTVEQVVVKRNDLVHQEKVHRNLLGLQTEYSLYPSLMQYEDEQHRLGLMFNFTKHFFLTKTRLADLLQISHSVLHGQMAIKLAKAGNIETAVEICGELYESSPTESTADILYKVTRSFLNLQAEADTEGDTDQASKFRVLPELCFRLDNQALVICSPDKLCEYLELAKECSLLVSVSQQCETEDNPLSAQWNEGTPTSTEKGRQMVRELSLPLFEEDALVMTSSIAIPLVSKFLVQCHQDFDCDDADDDQNQSKDRNIYMPLCSKVIPVVKYLRDNGHVQLAFSFSLHMLYCILQHVQQMDMGLRELSEDQVSDLERHKQAFLQIHTNSQKLIKELVHTIIVKICNASKVDVTLALAYFTGGIIAHREGMDVLKQLIKAAGHQYKKLKTVTGLGIALGEMFTELALIDTCRQLETNAHWGYRLSLIKVSFKEVLHKPDMEKHKLLPLIAKSELVDTQFLKEFCQAFHLDQDTGLLMYLECLFTTPDDGTFGSTSNKQLMLARAKEVIPEIKKKDELMTKMRAIYYRTSSYDYESLDILFEVLKMGDCEKIPVEKGIKLLEYLKVYTRQSEPTEYEIEYRAGGDKKEAQFFMESLPPESKYRLPFHPILHGDAWKIIIPELRRDSVTTWLEISKLLDLAPEQICMTAVQNMVKSYTDSFSKTDRGTDLSLWQWNKDQANLDLLKETRRVMENIKNCESFLALGKWMVKNLPLGSEKVLVLEQLIRYSELWHLSIPEESAKREKAKAAYLKFQSHWAKLSSAEALCSHGLGEPDLIQMTEKPDQLIQKLYEHSSISEPQWEKKTTKPDIHGAIEKLAVINSIQLKAIQRNLLQKWLQTASTKPQEDETMTFSLDNLKLSETFMEVEEEEEVNIKRIVHMMQRGCQKDNILTLYNYGFAEGQDTDCCICALKCLLYIADDETLISACSKSFNDIRDYLYIMIYIGGLEKLHVNHTVSTFTACQKENLVKGLWKKHSYEKSAACLVASLCLDYKIYDHQLWSSVLQRMYSCGLLKELETVLIKLNGVPKLWKIQPFSKMWYNVISSALSKVCPPLSQEQIITCVHYYNLLMRCPVLLELDCASLSVQFRKLELYGCAMGCLLFSKSEKDESVQEFIKDYSKEILQCLPNLQRSGLTHGTSEKIKEAVYKYIVSSNQYELVMDIPNPTEFAEFCVRGKNIDGLLTFGIKNKRLTESKQLIGLYCHTYPEVNDELSDYIEDEDVEEKDQLLTLLKAYLRMQNLQVTEANLS